MADRCFAEARWQALAGLVLAGAEMQRDDDYLRQVLLDMEAASDWRHEGPDRLLNPTEEGVKRSYHLLLLIDGGLVTLLDFDGDWCRLTNAAHDFLAVTRQSEAWEAVKGGMKRMGGATVGMMAKLAEAFAMQKARELGLLPG